MQAAHLLQQLLPHLHQAERAPADKRDRAHRAACDRRERREPDRDRHPGPGDRFLICGRQTSRPSRSSAAVAAISKVVAGKPIPGLSGRVDPTVPQLSEPGESVCVHRVELLQHDGIPDADHGPAAARDEAARGDDLRGDRGGQLPVPRPDARSGRRHGLRSRTLRRSPVVLFQPAR